MRERDRAKNKIEGKTKNLLAQQQHKSRAYSRAERCNDGKTKDDKALTMVLSIWTQCSQHMLSQGTLSYNKTKSDRSLYNTSIKVVVLNIVTVDYLDKKGKRLLYKRTCSLFHLVQTIQNIR